MMQQEFQLFKQEIEEKMINEFLNYIKDGTLPKANANTNMYFYDMIYNLVDNGLGAKMLEYHNEKIKQGSNECYEKIKNLEGIEFLNAFITYTERLNFFIHHMSKIFQYISCNYILSSESKNNIRICEEDQISEFSMKIYRSSFFYKLKKKLYEILNKEIIKEEGNWNIQDNAQIETIMNILYYLDLTKPKISKAVDTSIIWIDTAKYKKDNQFSYQNEWLFSFKDAIRNKYVKDFENKIEKIIQDNSIKEKFIMKL